ncbi:MAG TPA: hypothetical protein ENI80_06285 [Acidiferrobacteraceae bacterium]|nr:hypothetical protein [Acidiferrobacteraceae bacterium]
MAKTIYLYPGRRIKIFSRSFSSMPLDYVFEAHALHAKDSLSGKVEIRGSQWLMPKPPHIQPLGEYNEAYAGMWDTFFSIYVTADTETEIVIPHRRFGSLKWIVAVVIIVVLLVATVLVIGMAP